jgi:hypothetical protein
MTEKIRVMVFNPTFNNILVISWRSVLLLEETGVPKENIKITLIYVFVLPTFLYSGQYKAVPYNIW